MSESGVWSRLKKRLPRLFLLIPPWLRRRLFWLANDRFTVGACVLIFNGRGEILLFKHTYRPDGHAWGLPGGGLKHGESPEQALVRELYEEARLKIHILRPLLVDALPDFPQIDLFYLGVLDGGEFQPSFEVSEIRFFKLDGLPPLYTGQKELIERTRASLLNGGKDAEKEFKSSHKV